MFLLLTQIRVYKSHNWIAKSVELKENSIMEMKILFFGIG